MQRERGPVVLRLIDSQSTKKQRVDSASDDDKDKVDLMSLEEKIKALEQSLENSSSSSSSSEDEMTVTMMICEFQRCHQSNCQSIT